MSDRLREDIVDQFSRRGGRAEIWRGFDLFLDTGEFLNLGYSGPYQSHLLGSPQRRLAAEVGADLAARLPETEGVGLLDLGCGRGGPAVHLAERFGFDVAGVDLVPYNVATAGENARRHGVPASFAVGDATRLPFDDASFRACTSIDAVVYMPEKAAVFGEVARVVREGGPVAVSDLVARGGAGPRGEAAVEAFARAWDMPPLPTVEGYRGHVEDAGLTVETVRDISANSVGRFRKWTRLYLALADHAGGALERALGRWDLDADAITDQVRRAHAALPYLRHVMVSARR